jgi:hypothetical protein
MSTPMIPEDLIFYLAEQFPDIALDATNMTDTERQIWFRAGQVSVVRHLKRVMADQQDNILTANKG